MKSLIAHKTVFIFSLLVISVTNALAACDPNAPIGSDVACPQNTVKPFRGKVTYQGTYSARLEQPIPANKRGGVRVGGVYIPTGPESTFQDFNGAITIELEFDGQAVTGRYTPTGAFNPGKLSGLVVDGQCEFTDTKGRDTSRLLARCDTKNFTGRGTNLLGSKQKVEVRYEAMAAQVENYDERDAKRVPDALVRDRTVPPTAKENGEHEIEYVKATPASPANPTKRQIHRAYVREQISSANPANLTKHQDFNSTGTELLKAGDAADKSRNYELAHEHYVASAKLGNSEAMSKLGYSHLTGLGIQQYFPLATHWYNEAARLGEMKRLEEAANRGDPHAMRVLAGAYVEGWGVKQSDELALRWFQEAAKRGDPDAMLNVGVLFQRGRVGDRDACTANSWYRKSIATDKGNVLALTALASNLWRGLCGKPDKNKARELLEVAMKLGYKEARAELARMTDTFHVNPEGQMCAYKKGIVDYAQSGVRDKNGVCQLDQSVLR